MLIEEKPLFCQRWIECFISFLEFLVLSLCKLLQQQRGSGCPELSVVVSWKCRQKQEVGSNFKDVVGY